MNINIFEAKQILIKYYKNQLNKLYTTQPSKENIKFLKIKFEHCFDCQKIGMEIIAEDEILKNKSKILKEKMEISFLLHDIGRFFELTNELNKKSHGECGADLLRINENINDKFVLIAIRNHDKPTINLENDLDYISLNNQEQKEAHDILLALKDSDKISNLYLFKRDNTVYTRKEKKYGFSEEYFEAIENKHLIDKKYKNTIFDSIAYYIIWVHELIFEGSKAFVLKNKLIDHLLNMYEFYIEEIAKNELISNNQKTVETNKNKMKQHLKKIYSILEKQKIIRNSSVY